MTDVRTPIRLVNAAGELVADQLIPPFDPMPDVILWGNRVFQSHTRKEGEPREYAEAFAYAIPSTRELIDVPGPHIAPRSGR